MPFGSNDVDFKEIYDAINDSPHPGTPISMSDFYNISFTDDTSSPSSGAIGIGGHPEGTNDMRGKTVGTVLEPFSGALGDTYQGGIVFYKFQEGDDDYVEGETHGLIAAPEDISLTTAKFNISFDPIKWVITFSPARKLHFKNWPYRLELWNWVVFNNENEYIGTITGAQLSDGTVLDEYSDIMDEDMIEELRITPNVVTFPPTGFKIVNPWEGDEIVVSSSGESLDQLVDDGFINPWERWTIKLGLFLEDDAYSPWLPDPQPYGAAKTGGPPIVDDIAIGTVVSQDNGARGTLISPLSTNSTIIQIAVTEGQFAISSIIIESPSVVTLDLSRYYPTQLLEGKTPGTVWGCADQTNIPDTTSADGGDRIGAGKTNTVAIVNGCTTIGAAHRCANLTIGEYSDWFLPSKDELNELNKIDLTENSSGTNAYWSSTQHNSSQHLYAHVVYASNTSNTDAYSNKGNICRVRAVREF